MSELELPPPADVLAFGAHPDDVELAIGGTVARLVGQGYRVVVADLSEGEMGTRGSRELRAREAEDAASILGVAHRECLQLPDGGILPDRESRLAVVESIRRHRPRLVLAPATEDLHPDHQHTGSIVREACFLAGLRRLHPGLPPHRPRSVAHYFLHTQHQPDFVVDVTETFETKRQACLAFKSQFHDPRSEEPATYISSEGFWAWWEARSRHYGNLIGATFGEPFLHQGPLPVSDPVALFDQYGYYPSPGVFRGEETSGE